MFSRLVISLLALFVCAVHSAPKRCCVIDQFETYVGQSITNIGNGQFLVTQELSHVAVDFKGLRVAAETNGRDSQGRPFTVKTIQLFSKNLQYTIIDQSCFKTTVQGLKLNKCIPDEATFIDEFFYGSEREIIYVGSWSQNSTEGNLNGTLYETVEVNTCTPVSFGFLGSVQQAGKIEPIQLGGSYMNFTAGIKDPDKWFTPPSFCPKAVEATRASLERLDPAVFRHVHNKWLR